MCVRWSVVGLGVASLALASCGADSGEPTDRPNILFVTLDTTRADYFSSYANAESTRVGPGSSTPVFDALAAEGVRFENASSASAVTPVSHATILTGKFPHHHGLRVISADSGFRLGDAEWYLPAALSEAGYSTAAVQSAFPVSSYFGFDRAFDEFHDFDGALEEARRPGGTAWNMDDLQRRSDATTDLAIEVSDRLTEPFFLWVHYWDPHDDLRLPPDDFLAEKGVAKRKAKRTEDQLYAAELDYVDREFGRLLAHLRAAGRFEDTLVVVTADHGEGLSDGLQNHAWRGHRLLYREQLHVPLILRFPPALESRTGVVVPEIVRTADIVPTLLDYLNLPADSRFDGRSLRPLIRGLSDEVRVAFSDQINGYDRNAHMVEKRPEAAFMYCVDNGEWKLIYRPHMPEASELFHLSIDPGERKNVFGQRPQLEQHLLTLLAREAPWVTAPFPPDGSASGDAGQALDALGYVESAIVEANWAWTCPVHRELFFENHRRCPECNELPIPIPAR